MDSKAAISLQATVDGAWLELESNIDVVASIMDSIKHRRPLTAQQLKMVHALACMAIAELALRNHNAKELDL